MFVRFPCVLNDVVFSRGGHTRPKHKYVDNLSDKPSDRQTDTQTDTTYIQYIILVICMTNCQKDIQTCTHTHIHTYTHTHIHTYIQYRQSDRQAGPIICYSLSVLIFAFSAIVTIRPMR